MGNLISNISKSVSNKTNNTNSQLSKDTRRDLVRSQMNRDMLVSHLGMPTGQDYRMGYTISDPLNQYQHVCDKCVYKQVSENHNNPLKNMYPQMQNTMGGPLPYDSGKYMYTQQHVCQQTGTVNRCVLE